MRCKSERGSGAPVAENVASIGPPGSRGLVPQAFRKRKFRLPTDAFDTPMTPLAGTPQLKIRSEGKECTSHQKLHTKVLGTAAEGS